MTAIFGIVLLACVADDLDTKFVQVHPKFDDPATFERSEGQTRAVVLIHGLAPHPFSTEKAKAALLHEWQKPDATLVRTLGADSDVFSFAYGQSVPVTEIAATDGFTDAIKQLRSAGYSEIALIGHSAGGLIARQFVEDNPNSAVNKVILICSPNDGASLAAQERLVRKAQEAFVKSLSKAARAEFMKGRTDKKIGPHVQFVCVVGDCGGVGDFVVSDSSQWSEDLQAQGIPAVHLNTTHPTAVRSARVAEVLAQLVREKQPRWENDKIASMRKTILGKKPPE